jgi:hypothetical protein
MKSTCIAAAFAFAVSLVVAGSASAAEKPAKAEKAAEKTAEKVDKAASKKGGAPVTLSGDMTCGKCGLSETDKCQNVLKVAEGGAETKYYLVHNDVAKKNHGKVCQGSSKATVKGTVSEEAGKKVLAATEITYQ